MKNVLFNMTSGDNSNDLPSEAENFQDPTQASHLLQLIVQSERLINAHSYVQPSLASYGRSVSPTYKRTGLVICNTDPAWLSLTNERKFVD